MGGDAGGDVGFEFWEGSTWGGFAGRVAGEEDFEGALGDGLLAGLIFKTCARSRETGLSEA